MNPRSTIRHLARRAQRAAEINTPDVPRPVMEAVQAANLREIPEASWADVNAALEHDPAYGLALARVLHAIATTRRNAGGRARADLMLLNALNACSDFENVLRLASETARRLAKSNDKQSLARVWLETAWAETYRGNLEAAEAYLARALRASEKYGDAPLTVRADWIRARILRERGELEPALALFTRVRAESIKQDNEYDAMRLLREIGHTHARRKPSDAFVPLDTARAFFVKTRCPLQVALCDYYSAQAALDLNHFQQASTLLRRAQQRFRKQGDRFFDAEVNLDFAYLCWFLDRPRDMLKYSQRAFTLLAALGAAQEIASAEINIGVALVALNRYAEAIPYYLSGLENALASGRTTKAAVCLVNLAEVYIKQGQPARALEHLLRARAMLSQAKNIERIVECDLYLAIVHVELGSYKSALAALRRARRFAAQEKMTTRLAQCALYLAQLYLFRGQVGRAAVPLRRARAHFARNNQMSHVAWCNRLLAEFPSNHGNRARALLDDARVTFRRQRQYVEVAMCDLTRGELDLRRGEWEAAKRALSQAEKVLQNDFPDQHARLFYAHGQIALGQNRPQQALDYFVQSAQTLARVRRTLGLESLSNSFFGARERVVRDGLRLAHTQNAPEHALALMEAAKAQTFARALPVREWHLQQADPRVLELERRERELHDRLTGERAGHVVRFDQTNSPKPSEGQTHSPDRLALEKLSAAHERVANELRLTRHSFAGVPELDPFSLDAFRHAANRRWGENWFALEYFLDRGRLYIVSVTPAGLHLDARRWEWHEQHLLQQATHLHPEVLQLVFNRTIRGQKVELRENPLAELAEILLPGPVRALTNATLLIAPHRLLHQLAFQALELDGAPLAMRLKVAYTPTLQAYTQLCASTPQSISDNLLVCGVQKFHPPLDELEFTRREVNEIQRQHPDATLLWQKQATREQLMEWNQSGQLREFSILHFATHAFVRQDAPHLSAIHLDGQELTVLDLTNLNLDARLVALSACSGNLGQGGSGDEWVSLARSFFYAGARALVTSLWQVEDASTAKLMKAFYRALAQGAPISDALHIAQQELIRAGASPYQWAAFIAIGDV